MRNKKIKYQYGNDPRANAAIMTNQKMGGTAYDPNTGNQIGSNVAKGALSGMSFGPAGAIIGAGFSLVEGLIARKKLAEQEGELRKIQEARDEDARMNYSRGVVANYPTEGNSGYMSYYGYGGKRMYGKGGMMPYNLASGGRLRPLATGMMKAEGNTHEQGGIDLPGNVEVEDQEVSANVPDGQVWFSDRLKTPDGKTFAENAEKLGKMKAKSEIGVNSVNAYERGTAERNLQKIDTDLAKLEQEQNIERARKVVSSTGGIKTKAAFGTKAGELAVGLLPYVDNVANMFLTANTPKLPQPRDYKALPLKTDVNINASLADIENQQRAAVKGLENYTTDAGTLRANIIGAKTATVQAKNELFQNKENLQTQLKNQDVMNKQGIYNANIDQTNAFNMANFNRKIGIQERISGNLANLAEDAQYQIGQNRLEKKDKLTHEYLKLRFQESGVADRAINQDLDAYMSGDINDSEFDTRMQAHSNRMKQEKIDNAKGVAESEKQRQARLKELDEIKKEVMRLKKLGLMPPVEEKKPVPLLVPPRGLNR